MDSQILAAIIGAFIGAVVSGVLTFFLSIRQFRTEKWWELKVNAYQKIIDALHHSKKSASYTLQQEEGETQFSASMMKAIEARAIEANDEILRAIDTGSFLLSKKSVDTLKAYSDLMRKNWGEIDYSLSLFEFIQIDLDETNKCLTEILALAKEDLS